MFNIEYFGIAISYRFQRLIVHGKTNSKTNIQKDTNEVKGFPYRKNSWSVERYKQKIIGRKTNKEEKKTPQKQMKIKIFLETEFTNLLTANFPINKVTAKMHWFIS